MSFNLLQRGSLVTLQMETSRGNLPWPWPLAYNYHHWHNTTMTCSEIFLCQWQVRTVTLSKWLLRFKLWSLRILVMAAAAGWSILKLSKWLQSLAKILWHSHMGQLNHLNHFKRQLQFCSGLPVLSCIIACQCSGCALTPIWACKCNMNLNFKNQWLLSWFYLCHIFSLRIESSLDEFRPLLVCNWVCVLLCGQIHCQDSVTCVYRQAGQPGLNHVCIPHYCI